MDMQFSWPHVICCQQEKFSRSWLEQELFPEARQMRKVVEQGGCDILRGKRGVSLFYEPSTRTAGSLAMAIDFLGGKVVFSTDNAREFSSAKKGEAMEDTIAVWNSLKPDVVFLRYDREIGAEIAATVSAVPIINAGDRHPKNGEPKSPYSGQHPTQAFLDLFTIQECLGSIDGIRIAMCGDLKNGRTVRSNCYLLAKNFKGVEIDFVSPLEARMKDDIKEYLTKYGVKFREFSDLRDVAPVADVIYQTRTQKECGSDFERNKQGCGFYLVDETVIRAMKKHAIIMHPLPRVDEIAREVDNDPRAVYLTRQVESGLYTRMALLKMILAPKA